MKSSRTIVYLLLSIFVGSMFSACSSKISGGGEDSKNKAIAEESGFYMVGAKAETTPVASPNDAADDIAIWYNHNDPSKSTIIATDKQKGLVVYNFDGEEIYNYPIGLINNVDIRTKFGLGGDSITLVGGTNRTDNSIILMKVNTETGALEELELSAPFKPKSKEVYGFCLYRFEHESRFFKDFQNRVYAISIGTDGLMDQWELVNDNGKVKPRYVRVVKFNSQCEGLVADDETGDLYVGEETVGIWKMKALPAEGDNRKLISRVSSSKLEADVEGLSIYYGGDTKGYLIASSQGNNSFAVFSRGGDNRYQGSFVITGEGKTDGVSETDGIDVINLPVGSDFPDGVFIAQDGYNYNGEQQMNQNFKLVNWKDIASQFKPWLLIDNKYVSEKDKVNE